MRGSAFGMPARALDVGLPRSKTQPMSAQGRPTLTDTRKMVSVPDNPITIVLSHA